MMPQLTPQYSFSALCDSIAISFKSYSLPATVFKATAVDTSIAALEESPEPKGTEQEYSRSHPTSGYPAFCSSYATPAWYLPHRRPLQVSSEKMSMIAVSSRSSA